MGNKGTIKVDLIVLEAQRRALDSLCANASLKSAQAEVQRCITGSAGSTAATMQESKQILGDLARALDRLFTNSRDFLANTHTSFIEADAGLAERIRNSGQ
jgi:uncharacterized protein YukE